VCDDANVVRVPSAKVHVGSATVEPATRRSRRRRAKRWRISGRAHRKLREVVRQHEKRRRRFPEEARKIHYEKVPARPIRGRRRRTRPTRCATKGIDFASLPRS